MLTPGLYLGYLKLCTSVEQIRALVPQKLPNVLCHTKIRDNSNVSRWGSHAINMSWQFSKKLKQDWRFSKFFYVSLPHPGETPSNRSIENIFLIEH